MMSGLQVLGNGDSRFLSLHTIRSSAFPLPSSRFCLHIPRVLKACLAEIRLHVQKSLIIIHFHVCITLRVGYQWSISVRIDLTNHAPQIHWRSPGGSLDQKSVVSMKEEVILFEPFHEKRIQHIFRGESELNLALPCLLQALEPGPEVSRLIRDILHNMWGAPKVGRACRF